MTVHDKAKEYTMRRFFHLKPSDILGYNGQAEGAAYAEGMRDAFRMIEQQIDFCCVNNYKFPILHIRDFIDTMLEKKCKNL